MHFAVTQHVFSIKIGPKNNNNKTNKPKRSTTSVAQVLPNLLQMAAQHIRVPAIKEEILV